MKSLNGYLIALVILAFMALGVLYSRFSELKRDRDRINNNYIETVEGLNQSLALTKAELRTYLLRNKELDSLLKAERIKPAQVKYITRVEHTYVRDTVEVEVLPQDANKPVYEYPITYNDGCLAFSGDINVEDISIRLNKIEYKDEQTHVGYLKKKDTGRRFLWIFPIRKKFLELHTESKCGGNKVEHINISYE